jgi:hypothetical protein
MHVFSIIEHIKGSRYTLSPFLAFTPVQRLSTDGKKAILFWGGRPRLVSNTTPASINSFFMLRTFRSLQPRHRATFAHPVMASSISCMVMLHPLVRLFSQGAI